MKCIVYERIFIYIVERLMSNLQIVISFIDDFAEVMITSSMVYVVVLNSKLNNQCYILTRCI
jgi:hypothetical protein